MRIPTREEVAAIEASIDAVLDDFPAPALSEDESKWLLLTVAEDLIRLGLWRAPNDSLPTGESPYLLYLCSIIDDTKYGLRYTLDRISRKSLLASELDKFPVHEAGSYTSALQFLRLANDYRHAIGAFSFYHFKITACTIDDAGKHLHFLLDRHEEPYLALHGLLQIEEGTSNPMAMLAYMLKHFEEAPDFAQAIGQSVVISRKGRVLYDVQLDLVRQMEVLLTPPTSHDLIPEGWEFPWCSRGEALLILWALTIRCCYHIVAVHFAAAIHSIDALAVDDICLRLKPGDLVQEIHRISGVKLPAIIKLLEVLKFGHLTQTPDPGLQPLVPTRKNLLLIPCLHIASSQTARNLLSLQARIAPESFDASSHRFEQEMMRSIAECAARSFPIVVVGKQFAPSGEIDLAIVDVGSKTVLLGELRWMIPPGDTREIVNRRRVCNEKITQVRKKVNAVTASLGMFLGSYGITDSEEWRVCGFVATEGFVMPSADSDLPILPSQIVKAALNVFTDASSLHRWMCREEWLPQKGPHYKRSKGEYQFEQFSFSLDAVGSLRPIEYFSTYLKKVVREK